MALWCLNVPAVNVRLGSVARLVTFVYPYYENADFFQVQLQRWSAYPADLRNYVSAIVVDDGSPVPAVLPNDLPFNVRLFRIDIDIRWNWLAARNIGMHHSNEGWCLLTDMDHVVPEETLRALVYGEFHGKTVYAFQRVEHTGELIHPHSATFFLTRQTFWKTGGYDEALSGYYGTDGDFRRRLAKVAPLALTQMHVERWEKFGDASTKRYARKQPVDAQVKKLVSRRAPGWKPMALTFPYREVGAHA